MTGLLDEQRVSRRLRFLPAKIGVARFDAVGLLDPFPVQQRFRFSALPSPSFGRAAQASAFCPAKGDPGRFALDENVQFIKNPVRSVKCSVIDQTVELCENSWTSGSCSGVSMIPAST